MSALSRSDRAHDGWPPPRLFKLLGAVLGGEVLGAVTLELRYTILGIGTGEKLRLQQQLTMRRWASS